MSTSAIRTAIVAGGGIAGTVAATALRMAGIDARVYEAHPADAAWPGSGLALAPNGLAALDIIGAGDAVRAIDVPVQRTRMSVGRHTHELPGLDDLPPLSLVDRAGLVRVLREHAAAAGVPFEFGARLTGADEHEDGVAARFADGRTATADILIGADGIRSAVRGLIDPAAPGPEYTGMLGFGAVVPCEVGIPAGTMQFAYGKRAYYLYCPLGDGRVMWGANLPHSEYLTSAEARAIPAEQWLRTLRETYAEDTPGAALTRATTPETLEVWGALHIMPPVPHWYRDRLVLVGDAVHAPSNSSGQGASLAIESAVELARCLRDLPTPGAAFAAYEALRRPRVEGIAARAAKINHSKAPGPVARVVMNLLMPIAMRMMDPEKMLGTEQRHRIDWNQPITA
ncbi:FAD-dependent monooxygenase [Nocardia harenae]|uniref:FAD-dependent monooxygenase n=1 Tax=Nocardia harenae TaxID=358707 RepID=UPI00083371B2|nr:FAD-dependent monooxygenase [Nocardia harenae]